MLSDSRLDGENRLSVLHHSFDESAGARNRGVKCRPGRIKSLAL